MPISSHSLLDRISTDGADPQGDRDDQTNQGQPTLTRKSTRTYRSLALQQLSKILLKPNLNV